jgi:thymidylate synthase (FAD)
MAKVISTEHIQLLDHGFLNLIDTWGSDERIIEAARMSTDGAFKGWGCWKCLACGTELQNKQPHTAAPGIMCTNETEFERIQRDEKLLRYLWENAHHTPFEMGGLTVEVQAPIFVFREWHRHRVPFSYNELSARYTPLPDLNYIPTVERLMINAGTSNKQAGTVKGSKVLTVEEAQKFRSLLQGAYEVAQTIYEKALDAGVPKELARVHLPVGRYSRMRASANLRGWLNFLKLRMASGAQWEIRQYANALGTIIQQTFPRTWELFAEGLKA